MNLVPSKPLEAQVVLASPILVFNTQNLGHPSRRKYFPSFLQQWWRRRILEKVEYPI